MMVTKVISETHAGSSRVGEKRKVVLDSHVQMRDLENALPSSFKLLKTWENIKETFAPPSWSKRGKKTTKKRGESGERDVWDAYGLLAGGLAQWKASELTTFIGNLKKKDVFHKSKVPLGRRWIIFLRLMQNQSLLFE